ncbi:hypothetical protein ACGF3J_11035 [Streptomyces sp. NPDC048171]|uniref:hypothetical protein n=1 Tax=Streptomyces sp. NPDC048171 TaxID=3365504 RepID=UPI00371D82C3
MTDVPPSLRPLGVTVRRFLPPPALCGFLLLLVLVFSVSYAAGSAAGPVAPGMHGTGGGGGGGDGTGGGMEDMPGMDHGSGH